jgi:hypothetical protein
MAPRAIPTSTYRERIVGFLGGQAEPLTLSQIMDRMRPAGKHSALRAVLEEMVESGEVIRGEITKFNHTWDTWRLARPTNRVSGFFSGNGHVGGHAEPILATDPPLSFFDSRKIVEDLFLGIESLRVLAERLEIALSDWPNLPIGELIERHCHATGKDPHSLILREILPLLIASEASREASP